MAGVNKAILVGNLGRDPEIRYTPDGLAVTNFSIATSEVRKDKNTGEKITKTEWHRIVAFGKIGEICGKWLKKGKQVYIEGRIQTRSWEQDGITKYMTEIIADTMQMLGSRQDSGSANNFYSNDNANDGGSDSFSFDENSNQKDDDVPF